jgi:hypothetical protein
MAAVVVVEAVAIAGLGLLVCGLLRSHSEILRTLNALDAGVAPGRSRPNGGGTVALGSRRAPVQAQSEAVDLVGTTPDGESVQLGVRGTGHDTLLAFLSSGCHTCGQFWRTLDRRRSSIGLPDSLRVVVVTKGPAEESVSRIRELAPPNVPLVMSTEAWKAYRVPVTPYFIRVEGPSGRVVGQGAGRDWSQVTSLLLGAGRTVAEQEAGVDRKLLAAGIRPGDPSLYPSRSPGPTP